MITADLSRARDTTSLSVLQFARYMAQDTVLRSGDLGLRDAGSGDRAAIGNLVYDGLRRRRSLAAQMGARQRERQVQPGMCQRRWMQGGGSWGSQETNLVKM